MDSFAKSRSRSLYSVIGINLNCVVPENIHTPPPRKTLWFAPPPPTPQDFLFQEVFDDPTSPRPREFPEFKNENGDFAYHPLMVMVVVVMMITMIMMSIIMNDDYDDSDDGDGDELSY